MLNNDIVPDFDNEKDDSLKIKLQKIEEVQGCMMLALTGYIDTYNSASFQKRVQKAIDCGFTRLIFQCSSLNYVSSAGIGSFINFNKILKPQGGGIVMIDIQPKVHEVFQLLGFSKYFNIRNNLEESINFFNNEDSLQTLSFFPSVVSCPICYQHLKVTKAGRFRCSECKSILIIDETVQVLIE